MHIEQEQYQIILKEMSAEGHISYLGNLLARAVQKWPHNSALICNDTSITYKELYYRAIQVSRDLQKRGVKKGDRILLYMQNSIGFYIAYFATIQIGAVVVPLNTFLSGRSLQHVIADAQPAAIFVSARLHKNIEELQDITLPPVIVETEIDTRSEVPQELPTFEVIQLQSNELVALLYTSGTTGLPKGVMLSSINIMTNIAQGLARLQITQKERIFGVLPLFHSFAQLAAIWFPFFIGSTVIVIPRIDRRYILKGLQYKPTIFLGVPALYGLLCLLKTAPLDSVNLFISGGDALSDKIRMYFGLLYRRKICSGYGLTETSPLISFEGADQLLPTSCVGKPVQGIECSVRDEQGKEVAHGEIGRLWVKGDNVMLGYYNAKEVTNNIVVDGWLDTGDLVYLDKHGRIVITGRLKDLIIHKGLNIYPQEIENVITLHPAVIRVGVVGKKENATGEIPIAFVQLKEEVADIEKQLHALCKKQLAVYKIPKQFICSKKELPLTATGKVDKKELRKGL